MGSEWRNRRPAHVCLSRRVRVSASAAVFRHRGAPVLPRISSRRTGMRFAAGALAAATLATLATHTTSVTNASAGARVWRGHAVHVIVTAVPGAATRAAHAVEHAGGRVLHMLPVIGGFDAVVPAPAIAGLSANVGVRSVTPDGRVHLNTKPPDPTSWKGAAPYDAHDYSGSLYNVARQINADDMWGDGISGKGVGVALIDSGVAPVPNIAANLVNGPDLSLDATGTTQDGVDAFGHGTHMGGIIAGKDPSAPADPKDYKDANPNVFLGIAPN